MTRKLLLQKICPNACINDCRFIGCSQCNEKLNTYLGEYDKHVIAQYEAEHGNLADMIREIHDCVAKEMYCKGIDDFVHKIKERQYVLHILSDFMNCEDYGMFTVGIEEIAEELKAGDKE